MKSTIAVHRNPIWRSEANHFIFAEARVGDSPPEWEQLWSRQTKPGNFILCCIPYFTYDLALGDEVEASLNNSDRLAVTRVVKRSDHWTLRLWFGYHESSNIRAVLAEIARVPGCLLEAYTAQYIAADAASFEVAERLVERLTELQNLGKLTFEKGWR